MSNQTTRKVIKISSIKQKPTQRGKMMWTITDENDDYYSIFDEFVRSRIVEGQTMALMVEIAEKGGKAYKNIVGIADTPPDGTGVNMNDLLPDAAPAPKGTMNLATSSQDIQDTPPPAPRPVAIASNNAINMVEVRIAALNNAVRLAAGGKITAQMIEHNCREFEKYLIGAPLLEQNSSSESEAVDEYVR